MTKKCLNCKKEFIKLPDAEIAEVTELLVQADKLGIVESVPAVK